MPIKMPAFGQRATVFDIETVGFTGPILCIVECVLQSGEFNFYADQRGFSPLAEGVAALEASDVLIGHNVIGFDIPRLRKFLGANLTKDKAWDTLTATRLLWPDLYESDAAKALLPPTEWGKHSLRAWGHRLGQPKGSMENFNFWSPRLMQYCHDDVITSCALLDHILDRVA